MEGSQKLTKGYPRHGRVGLKKVQEASKRADLPGRLQKARAVALEKFKRVKQPNRTLYSPSCKEFVFFFFFKLRNGENILKTLTPMQLPTLT